MRILLLGKEGQVGWELHRALLPLGEVIGLGRRDLDLSSLDHVRDATRDVSPSVIVNAAAYSAVDQAETDVDIAYRVNADAVAVLSEEARRANALLVHYSTDYVFDGTKGNAYVEVDATNPLNVYGASKLKGELHVASSNCANLILRTSWVYATRRSNFPLKILRRAAQEAKINVVDDQCGAPTPAGLVADVTALMLYRYARSHTDRVALHGVYHLSAAGSTSWHAYARDLLTMAYEHGAQLLARPDDVSASSSSAFAAPARRPLNSRLDTDKLRRVFDVSMPHWRVPLRRFVQEFVASGGCS